MKDEELNSEVKALAAKWWKKGKISHLWGTDTELELAAFVRSVASKGRDEGLEAAMRAQCGYCRRGCSVDDAHRHRIMDGLVPVGESGRWVPCPAASIRRLKSGRVEKQGDERKAADDNR